MVGRHSHSTSFLKADEQTAKSYEALMEEMNDKGMSYEEMMECQDIEEYRGRIRTINYETNRRNVKGLVRKLERGALKRKREVDQKVVEREHEIWEIIKTTLLGKPHAEMNAESEGLAIHVDGATI